MKRQKAFTLIEIMLAVILMGILTAIVVPNMPKPNIFRIKACRSEIKGPLSMALDLYELDAGTYPTTSQGLKALIERPSTSPEPLAWNGPYLKTKIIPKDPWQHEYIYESPGRNLKDYDLSSKGIDNIAGNEDDINNWDTEKSLLQ